MSTHESYTTTNPYGETAECAKFVIDDITNPFVLSNIATVGQSYMFSVWLMSEAEGNLIVAGTAFSSSASWTKHEVHFTASSVDLQLRFAATGTYYLYHPQLEIGTKATDWTPAPEDVEDKFSSVHNDLEQTIRTQEASIIETSQGIFMTALEEYVKTSDYEDYKSEMSADLDVRFDGVGIDISKNTTKVEELDGEVKTTSEQLSKHFDFTENGFIIRCGEHAMKLRLDDNMISFYNGDIDETDLTKNRFGWWDGYDFHTGNIVIEVTERAQFGNFAFLPRSDGSLSLLKVADDISTEG